MELKEIGITPQKLKQFEKRDIFTVEDLLRFYPNNYRDYRKPVAFAECAQHSGETVVAVGKVVSKRVLNGKHTMCKMQDAAGDTATIFWFNQPYRFKYVESDREYAVGGPVTWDAKYGSASFASPDFFERTDEAKLCLKPMYRKIGGMADIYLRDAIDEAIDRIDLCSPDYLTRKEQEALSVRNFRDSVLAAHHPQDEKDIEAAQRRQVVDALYPFCVGLEEKKNKAAKNSWAKISSVAAARDVAAALPYELTPDQKSAVNSIVAQMKTGKRVDALVQGDVGCGKTVVAVILAAVVCNNGFQTAVMCPTTVLASQHYEEFSRILCPLGYTVELLQSGLKAAERKKKLADIASGRTQVVIGTQAIFGENVQFSALALTVVDEEHRFGVRQREMLRQKAEDGIHSVSMSATPIPRSIAMTIYGEGTGIVNIRTRPAGRKPVKTILYSNEEKVYQSICNQIQQGHQCYVVCPLIETSDSELLEGVDSVEATKEKMEAWFSRYANVKIETLTGDMKAEELHACIQRFADNKAQILIATTVVEVGVNIPNATVMLIKNAERFGLAQLHQLRGRVGRSSLQSYCVLLSEQKDNERLLAMVETNDGFEIAQKDLELRGTGQLLGTKQSGTDGYIEMMLQYPDIYRNIRELLASENAG